MSDREEDAPARGLSPAVEAEAVDRTYSAAFDLVGKHRGNRTDAELLERLRRTSQGRARVAHLAAERARATWDLNPNDEGAAAAHRLLTDLAAGTSS